jgi:type 1 glutamine amidotransferase
LLGSGLAVLVLLAAVGGYVVLRILPAMGGGEPVIDTVPPELPADLAGELVILDFSKTAGFRHVEAIAAAHASLDEIAAARGWGVFRTENAAVFNAEQLARFDVVLGNNITGDNWTEAQKQAFIEWIDAGGGFVGIHGAAGTRYRYWDWYTDVLLGGGRFVGHPMFPQFQQATIHVEDPDHPAMAHWGERFEHSDEWYSFEQSARDAGSHVLATLDETTYEPKAFGKDLAMGDHPIIWTACPGAGRSFYSALGHSAETYARPEHAVMLEGAILWAAGRVGSCD